MRYGICFPIGGECADPRILAEFAALAEATGWDGVFLEDYIIYTNPEYYSVPGFPTHDPWVALAAMAMSTERVRLGTTVTPLPRRRPWKLAREVVSLDHLSRGRVILGVGLGDIQDKSFTHFGEVTDTRRRARMTDEALAVLAGLWSGEPFRFQGEYFTVDEVTFLPRPVQVPRIPIWVGGIWPRQGVIRRAPRWDGVVPYRVDGDMTLDDVRDLRALIERERGTVEGYDIVAGGRPRPDDWDAEREIIRGMAETGATWWCEWVPAADYATMRAAVERGPLRIDA